MVYNEKKVELLRQRYPEGTRICLDHMEDLCPVESGTKGTIIGVDDIGSVMVKWDNGRTLAIIPGEDSFTVLPPKLETLKLYAPLTAELYERNCYGDLEDESVELDGRSLLINQDQIAAALLKNRNQ